MAGLGAERLRIERAEHRAEREEIAQSVDANRVGSILGDEAGDGVTRADGTVQRVEDALFVRLFQ